MKITIRYNNEPVLDSSEYSVISIGALDTIDNASCEEVRLDRVLDEMEESNRINILTEAIAKLRYGATLSLEGLDYAVLCRNVGLGKYTPEEVNKKLYSYKVSGSLYFLQGMIDILTGKGLEVVSAKYSSEVNTYECPYYSIKVRRPNVKKQNTG